jgi:hypothetical protein
MILTLLDLVEEHTLPSSSFLQRVQIKRSRPGTVAIGPVRLPPSDLCIGRFDIPATPVGYFAEMAETAMYEALARRERTFLAADQLRSRALLTVRTSQDLRLLDLRPCAHDYPVLQSLRYSETQTLALEAFRQGYDGIAYHSAQQHAGVCYALFQDSLRSTRKVRTEDLVHPASGTFHRALVNVLRGSAIPLA